MSIVHCFRNQQWHFDGEKYSTNSSTILYKVPYDPEILVLGTFNPLQPGNRPEFFYGRNYFWPALFNLMGKTEQSFDQKREAMNPPKPTLNEILEFCKTNGFVFADLISEILYEDNPHYTVTQSKRRGKPVNEINFKERIYNAINDKKRKDRNTGRVTLGLAELHTEGQVLWEDVSIMNYIKDTTSIKTVYLTFNPQGIYKEKWKAIKDYDYNRKVDFRRIFTPSAQGSAKGVGKMEYLINHWLGEYDFNGNYEGLDVEWVQSKSKKSAKKSFNAS